jgi:hypothetical protein
LGEYLYTPSSSALGPWKISLGFFASRSKVTLLYQIRSLKNFKKIKKLPSMLEVAHGRKIALLFLSSSSP